MTTVIAVFELAFFLVIKFIDTDPVITYHDNSPTFILAPFHSSIDCR